jgi:hypothetical protein
MVQGDVMRNWYSVTIIGSIYGESQNSSGFSLTFKLLGRDVEEAIALARKYLATMLSGDYKDIKFTVTSIQQEKT